MHEYYRRGAQVQLREGSSRAARPRPRDRFVISGESDTRRTENNVSGVYGTFLKVWPPANDTRFPFIQTELN